MSSIIINSHLTSVPTTKIPRLNLIPSVDNKSFEINNLDAQFSGLNTHIEKTCNVCKIKKDIKEFSKDTYLCKVCNAIKSKLYYNTLDGFINKLKNNSKTRSKKRLAVGRIDASEHSINDEDIHNQYLKQDGKCYYSGIVMVHKGLNDWLMSLERLDNDKGYIKENIVLVCLEFNCSSTGWNKEKINAISKLQKNIINLEDLKSDIKEALIPKPKRVSKKAEQKVINDVIHHKCRLCDNFYPIEQYTTHIREGCIKCRQQSRIDRLNTLRGFVKRSVGEANDRMRTKSELKEKEFESSITDIDIYNLIIKQEGRCYYSGIPMIYKINSNWKCSIERLNNKKGYILSNIVLICIEFNTADLSSISNNPDKSGSGQWSKEKFNIFMKSLESTK